MLEITRFGLSHRALRGPGRRNSPARGANVRCIADTALHGTGTTLDRQRVRIGNCAPGQACFRVIPREMRINCQLWRSSAPFTRRRSRCKEVAVAARRRNLKKSRNCANCLHVGRHVGWLSRALPDKPQDRAPGRTCRRRGDRQSAAVGSCCRIQPLLDRHHPLPVSLLQLGHPGAPVTGCCTCHGVG